MGGARLGAGQVEGFPLPDDFRLGELFLGIENVFQDQEEEDEAAGKPGDADELGLHSGQLGEGHGIVLVEGGALVGQDVPVDVED